MPSFIQKPTYVEVESQALLSDLVIQPLHAQQVGGRHVHVLAAHKELVRLGHAPADEHTKGWFG